MRVLNYIRGEFVDPESDFWMDNFSPSSGEVIGSIPLSGERDVDNAVMKLWRLCLTGVLSGHWKEQNGWKELLTV